MARMVRKQVYIEPRQEVLLKQRAREIGATEAEVIRRGLDLAISVSDAGGLEPGAKEAQARSAAQGLLTRSRESGHSTKPLPTLGERLAVWEEEKKFIGQRMAMHVPQTGRGWTREELYEERLGRWGKTG